MSAGTRADAPRRRPVLVRLLRWMLLLAVVALAGIGWWVHRDYRRFVEQELRLPGDELVLEVRRGDSFDHVLRRLRRLGVRDGNDLYWKALAWEQGVVTRLQVGEYAIRHGLTPVSLLLKLEQGKVIQHRFTLVEGWTFRDLRLALSREQALEQTLAGLPDEEVMRRLGAPAEHPEGRFLPETYHYTRGVTDEQLLKRAYIALSAALEREWERRSPDTPLRTPYEALILASIIEKETGIASERAEIAGVFTRRMKIGMRLQTDPTVIYGIGASFDGNLTRRHLQEATPYNTYVIGGLPPTPIALPGKDAIHAALHPADGDTLYFVARGDGGHVFSRTLDEHNRNVARYQLRRRK